MGNRLVFLITCAFILLVSCFLPAVDLSLNSEGVEHAIQYGRQFNTSYDVVWDLQKQGYQKIMGGWWVDRAVFLITDHVRVAVKAAEMQRRGEKLDVGQIEAKLVKKLDVLVLYSSEDSEDIPKKPVVSIMHPGGRLYAEGAEHMLVLSACQVMRRDGGISKPFFVDYSDFCNAMYGRSSSSTEMWLFRFSLPKEYWNSEIEVLSAEDWGKIARKKFDLSRLR